MKQLFILLAIVLLPLSAFPYQDEPDLVRAAAEGDARAVLTLLKKGVPIDVKAEILLQDSGLTQRHTALANTFTPILPQFQALGKFLRPRTDGPGRFSMVMDASGKAELTPPNCIGCTALLVASANGRQDVVKLLLEKGADVNTGDQYGITPLMAAAFKGHSTVVRLLLDKGAPIGSFVNLYGYPFSAISLAVLGGSDDTVSLLLERGARKADITALPFRAAIGATIQVENYALAGSILNAASLQDGRGRLLLSAFSGDKDTVKTILSQGTVQRQDWAVSLALLLGVSGGNTGVVKYLAANGGDVNMLSVDPDEKALLGQDTQVYSPLLLAVLLGNHEMAEVLLDKGADPNRKLGQTSGLLDGAIQKGHEQLVKTLLEHGAELDPLALFYAAGKPKIASLLLARKVDVTAKLVSGETALMLAAGAGDYDTTMLLIRKGADIKARSENGGTVLIAATQKKGDARILEYLLDHGLDPNARIDGGVNALEAAIVDGRPDLAALLRKKGAKTSVDAGKGTALCEAVILGEAEKVKTLAHDVEAFDKITSGPLKGYTAVTLAAALGDPGIVKDLLDARASSKGAVGKYPLGEALNVSAGAGTSDALELLLKGMGVIDPKGLGRDLGASACSRTGTARVRKKAGQCRR